MDKKYKIISFRIKIESVEILKEECIKAGYEDHLSLFIRSRILPKKKLTKEEQDNIENKKTLDKWKEKLKDQEDQEEFTKEQNKIIDKAVEKSTDK